MDTWDKLASKETVEKIIIELEKRGITAFFVQTKEDALKKVMEIIPHGSDVLVSTSVTAEQIGLKDEIDNSDDYISVRKQYMSLDHEKDAEKIRKLRSTPDYITGSVHAVTEKGEIIIASNTGSQIPGYAYSAGKVVWVVGTQKIVKNLDFAFKRLYEYVVPKEEKHMQDLYGIGTNVSKILIFNKEKAKDRVYIIFVNEVLGF